MLDKRTGLAHEMTWKSHAAIAVHCLVTGCADPSPVTPLSGSEALVKQLGIFDCSLLALQEGHCRKHAERRETRGCRWFA